MSRKYGWGAAKNMGGRWKGPSGDSMTGKRTCPICAKTVDASRLAKYPNAVVCGRRACSKAYKRAAFNTIRRRYRNRRLASDPAFGLREKRAARRRYVSGRLAAGKIVGPPTPLAPIPHVRGPIDTFLAGIRRDALTALLAPLAWFSRVLQRRRDRKTHRAWTEFLTRQGRGPDGL